MKKILKVKEALAYYTSQTGKKGIEELAGKLWEKSKPATQKANLYNFISGRTRPSPEQVDIICKFTGVDPNFLHGWGKKNPGLNG